MNRPWGMADPYPVFSLALVCLQYWVWGQLCMVWTRGGAHLHWQGPGASGEELGQGISSRLGLDTGHQWECLLRWHLWTHRSPARPSSFACSSVWIQVYKTVFVDTGVFADLKSVCRFFLNLEIALKRKKLLPHIRSKSVRRRVSSRDAFRCQQLWFIRIKVMVCLQK